MTLTEQPLPALGAPSEDRSAWPMMLLAIAVFTALSAGLATVSDGFLEADATTHYLYARFAFAEPHFFVNVWGRPVCTALYAIPAYLGGRMGVRLTSLGLAVGCALITWRIARNQGYRWPALALVFLLAQPLVFLHSFSELTELPFAVLIALAFWMYQTRRWLLLAAIAGILPLSRPEGFGFLAMAAAALILHRRARWLVLLPIPLILWNHVGWVLYGRPGPWASWLPDNWPYAAESLYAAGNLLHFLFFLPFVVSPLVLPATVIGAWQNLRPRRQWRTFFGDDHRTRCDILTAAIPLMIFVGHSVLYWLGKMASNGEVRYMLVVAPFWALLSARGWGWVFERMRWRWPVAIAGVVALLPLTANHFYKVLPLGLPPDNLHARELAGWYESTPLREAYPKLMVAHPFFFYASDMSSTDRQRVVEWNETNVAAAPPGTLLIWDPIYGPHNSDARRGITLEEVEAGGWVLDHVSHGLSSISEPEDWWIFRSPETVQGEMQPQRR